jgi:hypothetical protein
MKIAKPFVLNENSDLRGQLRDLNLFLDKLAKFAQGRVRFGEASDGYRGENIAGEFQVITDSGNANTEFTVAHDMDAIPEGFIVTNINKGGIVYDSGTAWTADNVYLKCSAANATITIFLLQ